jgi:hypothetical protein
MILCAYKIALVDFKTLHLAVPHLQSIVYRTNMPAGSIVVALSFFRLW